MQWLRTRKLWSRYWYNDGTMVWIGQEFKLADLWFGAFFSVQEWGKDGRSVDVWLCILPCLPLHIEYTREATP